MRRLAILLVCLALPAADPVSASPEITVFAHRGGADLAPENTLGAFRQAHALWPDAWIELDTQLAGGGELVVIHDHTLDATTTNCSGFVADHTPEQLAGCDARKGWASWPTFEHVPTLREALVEGEAAGWRLMIELKNIPGERNFDPTGFAAANELVALIDEIEYPEGDLLIQSFFPPSLDQVARLRPSLRTALLTTARLAAGAGFPATSNFVYATARGYDVSAPDHRSDDLSADTVAAWQAAGREVVVWTVDRPEDIARAISWGVDGIISDRPDLVFQALVS